MSEGPPEVGSAGTPFVVPPVLVAPAQPAATSVTQLGLFPKLILDDLGLIGVGATAPKLVRAEDDLLYAAKSDTATLTVRASEYLWLSVARLIHIPAIEPEILRDSNGNQYVATRWQPNAIQLQHNQQLFMTGAMHGAREQLVRVHAFDLFSGNSDRHFGNYLILNEGNALVLNAIDYSHVAIHPDLPQPFPDPAIDATSPTRVWFTALSAPYGCVPAPGIDIIDRLTALPASRIEAILTQIPGDWLPQAERQAVVEWWTGPSRAARAKMVTEGLNNGTYL